MSKVIFENYSIQVKSAIENNIRAVLHEVSGEMVAQVKRNSRVDTGQTKNSFNYKVTASDDGYTSYIGSNHENALWEELGTGEYALNGDGRKGGWTYRDVKGKFHHTYGKTPSRAFWKAYTSLKDAIINKIQNSFKGL